MSDDGDISMMNLINLGSDLPIKVNPAAVEVRFFNSSALQLTLFLFNMFLWDISRVSSYHHYNIF